MKKIIITVACVVSLIAGVQADTLYLDATGTNAGFWGASTSETWQDGAGGTQWNTDSGGESGTLSDWNNANADSAYIDYDNAGGNGTLNIEGSVTVSNLTINTSAGSNFAMSESGAGVKTINFVDNPLLTKLGSGNVTFRSALVLSNDFRLQVGTGFNMTMQQAYRGTITYESGEVTVRNVLATDENSHLNLSGGSWRVADAGAGDTVTHVIGNVQGDDTGSNIGAHNVNATSTLVIVQSANTTYAGTVDPLNGHTLNIVKSGSGSLTIGNGTGGSGDIDLTSNNGEGGSIAVSNGTLALNGSVQADHVRVENGGTLQGNGTIDTANESGTTGVVVNSGGTIGAGLSVGELTLADDLTLNDGSTMSMELDGGTVAGTDYDQITLDDGMSGVLTLSLTDINDLELIIDAGFDAASTVGDMYFLADLDTAGSSIVGEFEELNGVLTDLSQGSNFFVGAYEFSISYVADADSGTFTGGNDLGLRLEAIPEPLTLTLFAAALGLLRLARRRRV